MNSQRTLDEGLAKNLHQSSSHHLENNQSPLSKEIPEGVTGNEEFSLTMAKIRKSETLFEAERTKYGTFAINCVVFRTIRKTRVTIVHRKRK